MGESKDLVRKVRELERENERLAERSEDLMLLGLVSELIQGLESEADILESTLKRVSIIKTLPVAACGFVRDEEIQLLHSFDSGVEETSFSKEIHPPDVIFDKLTAGACVSLKEDAATVAGHFWPSAYQFTAILTLPFETRKIRRGLFLFGDTHASYRLPALSLTLQRLVEMVTSRLDNLALLDELKEVNISQDQKVARRTRELTDLNRELLAEIANRKRAEEAEHLCAHIFKNAEWGVAACSIAGRQIMQANPALVKMLGLAEADITGTLLLQLCAEPQRAELERHLLTAEQTGQCSLQTQLKRKDNSTFPALMSVTLIEEEDFPRPFFAVNIQDLSERVFLEDQLLQAQKMESIGRLAGGVAHDFNNFLSGIIGYSDLILLELPPGHAMRKKAEFILDSAQKAAALTRQLLAFSRKQVMRMEPLQLDSIVEHMAGMLSRIIGEDIELVIDTDTPTAAILADKGQLEQILMNLAVNARDAMPDGGQLQIAIDNVKGKTEPAQTEITDSSGSFVELRVSDTGTGMSREVQEKALEPFFTTKRQEEGTGLGLSTVYGIVQQHKAQIDFTSEPGHGTTFRIYFPVTNGSAQIPEAPDRVALPRGNESILLVDDSLLLRRLAADILSPLGYQVSEAASGQEALESLAVTDRAVDLILSDVIMPGLKGSQLVEALRSRQPEISIVLMSGYPKDHESIQQARALVSDYIQKPLTPKELAETVRKVLDA